MLAYSSNLYAKSTAEPKVKVSELVWPDSQQLAKIKVLFQNFASSWCAQWISVGQSSPLIEVSLAHESIPQFDALWHRFGVEDEGFWISDFSKLRSTLSKQLFGVEHKYSSNAGGFSLQSRVADDAYSHFLTSLVSSILVDQGNAVILEHDEQIPYTQRTPWSGCIHVSIQFLERTIDLLIAWTTLRSGLFGNDPDFVGNQSVRKSNQQLSKLSAALKNEIVSLSVEMAEVELDLVNIKNLCIGDVVRLGHQLDEPLNLRTNVGEGVCSAFLGKHGEHKAIELLR
ncbi:flagellar motor switch protein FliM [Undibacterium flavidum]|uniref:FliM/FliN family flagellar motor switch protein n=1 Tax=Undibacterium flavidum TaxID=2762297 RepID=A0ABR6YER3_9BURK|nr:flagellar motor switch protein FliM [Undibacterium flavidum]MBC3875054.1 FliM/FliN family flagellar motor switch protein [Undibacterium flavidum]